MERPLINHVKRSRIGRQVRNRVFRDNVCPHRGNERADTVIDKGIHVIGVSGDNHEGPAAYFMLTPAFLTHLPQLPLVSLLRFFSRSHRFFDFRRGDLGECFFNGLLNGFALV